MCISHCLSSPQFEAKQQIITILFLPKLLEQLLYIRAILVESWSTHVATVCEEEQNQRQWFSPTCWQSCACASVTAAASVCLAWGSRNGFGRVSRRAMFGSLIIIIICLLSFNTTHVLCLCTRVWLCRHADNSDHVAKQRETRQVETKKATHRLIS